MNRTLIIDCINKIDQEVLVSGWVQVRRDHGKIVFLDLADQSGSIQVVVNGSQATDIGCQDVLSIKGLVVKRPDKLINQNTPTGFIELQSQQIDILAKSEELPFDMTMKELDLSLPILLDYRPLTLRHPKIKSIFIVQAEILKSFREVAESLGCLEIIVPTIAVSSTEGGAEVFKLNYFNHTGYLTQSPQLYKQVMVGVFERVFTIAKAYRAEPSVTTRHLTESTMMDCEFGFVDFDQLLDLLEQVSVTMIVNAAKKSVKYLNEYGVDQPKHDKIPRLKLREVQEIIFKEFGRDVRQEKDLSPQDEVDICHWAVDKYNSDFVIVTHFPTKKRAFYTMPDPLDPEFSLSFDVLFKGLEISSGSLRITDYNQLKNAITERKMNPKEFEIYLQAFKFGMPPEGGFSFGLERITMYLLKLGNIKEASLFPRDMERVDIRLSSTK